MEAAITQEYYFNVCRYKYFYAISFSFVCVEAG